MADFRVLGLFWVHLLLDLICCIPQHLVVFASLAIVVEIAAFAVVD